MPTLAPRGAGCSCGHQYGWDRDRVSGRCREEVNLTVTTRDEGNGVEALTFDMAMAVAMALAWAMVMAVALA